MRLLGRQDYWEAWGYRQSFISISLICVHLDWGLSSSCSLQLKFSTGPSRAALRPVGEAAGRYVPASKNHTAKVARGVAGRVGSWLGPSLRFWPRGDLSLALEV